MRFSELYAKGVRHFAIECEPTGERDILIATGNDVWAYMPDGKGGYRSKAINPEGTPSNFWLKEGYVSAQDEVTTIPRLSLDRNYYGRNFRVSIPRLVLNYGHLKLAIVVEGAPCLEIRFGRVYMVLTEGMRVDLKFPPMDLLLLPAVPIEVEDPKDQDLIELSQVEFKIFGVDQKTKEPKLVAIDRQTIASLVRERNARKIED